ncbi:kinesin light chain [Parachaetomium inaequale]|uniref:Kinesin light chain n=1 Tax=Parachaetomium inaequale TaxID=2588326 RepID=A0AAN6SWC9_9PEZI|nr:kinesin light chain [Parachaetomium inaequale]
MASSKLSRLVDRTKRALSREPRTLSETVEHPQGLEVVSEGHDPIVDIVALHGLNGHREKTWMAENGVHWLRDLLPEDLPQARILCWGYDANTHASDRVSWQYLYDHARTLVSDLCRKRKLTNSIDRPIIFVAHSLGGLVLKSALIHSDAARQGALADHRSIKLSTHGILFMGTPHQGGNGVQLGRVLANVASLVMPANDRLLKHLERDSEWLQQQLGQYASISNDFVTKYAFEEYETPTVLGHKIMVVPKASAVVPGHADAEPIAIHADHTSMVRYPSKRDAGYVAVSEHLQIMVTDATDSVQQRWEGEARADDARGKINRFALSLSLSGTTETSHFVAREEELAWMHEKLCRQPGRCTVVVHGLGGMGKTQLAIAYMKRHRDDYSASIWLNARDETSLNQSFRNAAVRILREHPGLSYIQTAVSDKDGDASLAVRRWLDEPTNERWLLIYDNYDHPKMGGDTGETPARDGGNSGRHGEANQPAPEGYDIRQYLPDTDHGAVIVTTRSSTVQIGELLRLQKLRKIEDSLRILESTSGRTGAQDDAAALALARKLDGLPLALSTADYESAWGQLQKLSPQLLTYENRAMYTTWNISFESIRRRSESAAMLLRLWAFFGNEDLWYELLRRGGTEDGPKWLQDLTETRLAFDQSMRVLCSHGLVEAHSITAQNGSESSGYSVHAYEADNDGSSAWMPATLGLLYADQGRYKEAEAMYERALEGYEKARCKEKAWGPEHTSTLYTVNNLGNLYAEQGRYKEAEAVYERALEGKEKVWGPEHTSTLDTVNNLGNLYKNQGRHKEAEAMYERALEGYEKALGKDAVVTYVPFLDAVTNLGLLNADTGQAARAEELYKVALTGIRKVFGDGSDRHKQLEHLLASLSD